MHWNHRIVNCPSKNDGEDWYECKEVYYDNFGIAISCTENPARVHGETVEEIVVTLERMLKAASLPTLHEDNFSHVFI